MTICCPCCESIIGQRIRQGKPMISQRLLNKLQNINSGSCSPTDFIIADAIDGDMAFGDSKGGRQRYKTRADYLNNQCTPLRSLRQDPQITDPILRS